MSKHRSLDEGLRAILQSLEGAQRAEALECLGIQHTSLDEYYAQAAQLFSEVRLAGPRARRDSMTHTQQFAAVAA